MKYRAIILQRMETYLSQGELLRTIYNVKKDLNQPFELADILARLSKLNGAIEELQWMLSLEIEYCLN